MRCTSFVPLAIFFCLLLGSAPRAHACSWSELPPLQIDRSTRPLDVHAPSAFRDLTLTVRQVPGTHCENGSCSESSCGDLGVLDLRFAPLEDEDTGPDELGYRVVWLRGTLPDGLREIVTAAQPLSPEASRIVLYVDYDDVQELDGELALVAVDQAGNESMASAPLPVRWTGCVSYVEDLQTCLAGSESGCSVLSRNATAVSRLPPMAALGAGFAWWFRTRRKRRTLA